MFDQYEVIDRCAAEGSADLLPHVRTLACDFANTFDALPVFDRVALGAAFERAFLSTFDFGGAIESYSDAYHAAELQTAAIGGRFSPEVTGGADWSVDRAWEIIGDTEHGMFLLEDEGTWSIVARWHDEEAGHDRLETLYESDEWPAAVNVAHRIADAASVPR